MRKRRRPAAKGPRPRRRTTPGQSSPDPIPAGDGGFNFSGPLARPGEAAPVGLRGGGHNWGHTMLGSLILWIGIGTVGAGDYLRPFDEAAFDQATLDVEG